MQSNDGYDAVPRNKRIHTNRLIYFIICLLALTSNLPFNSLWVELPLLLQSVQPDNSFSIYVIAFLGIFEFCHLAPFIYLLIWKGCAPARRLTVPLIYSLFVPAVVASVVIAFFWRQALPAPGDSSSIMLLFAVFWLALVSALGPFVHIMFSLDIKTRYFPAFIIGNVLASLIPEILFVGQGLARGNCPHIVNRIRNESSSSEVSSPHALLPQPDFTVTTFFLIISAITVFGALCFLVLRCVPTLLFESSELTPEEEQQQQKQDNSLELTTNPNNHNMSGGHTAMKQATTTTTIVLDDGSYREGQLHAKLGNNDKYHWDEEATTTLVANDDPPPAIEFMSPRRAGGRKNSKAKDPQPERPQLFPFLMVITFWASYVLCGPLSAIKAYVHYPVGSYKFQCGIFSGSILSLFSCIWAKKTSKTSRVHLTIAMTSLASILFAYFIALIAFSPSHNFGDTGEWLTTLSWPVVVGLLTYSKATIGISCREHGIVAVRTYAYAIQLGATIGALHVLYNLTVSRVFLPAKCEVATSTVT